MRYVSSIQTGRGVGGSDPLSSPFVFVSHRYWLFGCSLVVLQLAVVVYGGKLGSLGDMVGDASDLYDKIDGKN